MRNIDLVTYFISVKFWIKHVGPMQILPKFEMCEVLPIFTPHQKLEMFEFTQVRPAPYSDRA